MAKTSQVERDQFVTMELGDSFIHMALQDHSGDETQFRCRTIQWRKSATLLNSTLGLEELTAALQQLSREEQLHHRTVHFLLDGAYCITRTARGSTASVRQRLDAFESRCSRYLLLGHGRKVTARSISEQTDETAVGMLTVANLRTLQSISQAVQDADLTLGRISAAVADLGRLIRKAYPRQQQQSGILLRPRETGVDLAIIDRGLLLLDARPVEHMDVGRMHHYVDDRLALFQRFFNQHSVSGQESLERIFLCGNRAVTRELEERFQFSTLDVMLLDDQLQESDWNIKADAAVSEYAGVLGAELSHDDDDTDAIPDLSTQLIGLEQRPLWKLALASIWPLAAALLLAVSLQMLQRTRHQRSDLDPVALQQHETLTVEELDISDELEVSQTRLQFGRTINQHLQRTPSTLLLDGISACLADSASLTSISMDAEGQLTLHGRSLSEQNVYQFAQNLERLPFISTAQLSGTGKTEDGNQLLTEFQVQARLRMPTGQLKDDDDA